MSTFVRLWGGLDVFYVFWRVCSDILDSKVPFYSSLAESLSAAIAFEQTSILILTTIGILVTLSIILSGPLMLMLNRVGVYISIAQLPFRLTLLIPPTFFFVQMAKNYVIAPELLFVAIILIMEIAKTGTEIQWLRSIRKTGQ